MVIRFKVVGDGGLGAEKIASETADTLLDGIEDVGAIQGFLELGGFGSLDDDVGRDAPATGDLTAAIGLTNSDG